MAKASCWQSALVGKPGPRHAIVDGALDVWTRSVCVIRHLRYPRQTPQE
jgi:hypothetical protein